MALPPHPSTPQKGLWSRDSVLGQKTNENRKRKQYNIQCIYPGLDPAPGKNGYKEDFVKKLVIFKLRFYIR